MKGKRSLDQHIHPGLSHPLHFYLLHCLLPLKSPGTLDVSYPSLFIPGLSETVVRET